MWNWRGGTKDSIFGYATINNIDNDADRKIADRIVGLKKQPAEFILKPYLAAKKANSASKLNKFIKVAEKNFHDKFEDACKALERITKRPMISNKFTFYVTTFPRMTVFFKTFVIYMYDSTEGVWGMPIDGFLHEALHFQFYYYWREDKTSPVFKLSEDEFDYFKEALTVILDDELKPLISMADNSYPSQVEFRDILHKHWQKYHDFDRLVEFGLKELPNYIKKELPKITFNNMSVDEVVDALSWMIPETDGPLPLSELLYRLYPELKSVFNHSVDDKKNANNIKTIKPLISKRYDEYLVKNNKLPQEYQEIWNGYNDGFMKALSERLNIEWPKDCYKITAGIGLIPVCPRHIKSRSFEIYPMDQKYVIETAMHECCHFLFFEKWKELFEKWKWKEFDSPCIIWYLSEILIDPILNCKGIQSVFMYNFRSYDSFYDVKIDGEYMMEYINKIFQNNNIEDAITKSCDYVLMNELTIREQCNDYSKSKVSSEKQ